jgi:hypothetical protein
MTMKRASDRMRLCASLCTVALVTALAASAHAQTAADRETARALFDDGKRKRDSGNVAGALEAFKGADAIMHAPTTGLAVARSLAALGRIIEAREAAVAVEQLPAGPKESAAFADARKSANQLAAELAGRIPSLTIVIKGAPAGVEPAITVDGVAVPAAAAKAPRRLDPGTHVVVAAIKGGQVKGEITLNEHDEKSIDLDVTDLVAPKQAAKPEGGERPAEGGKGSYSPLLWVGVGVAVVGAAAGTVTGLVSMGKTSDVESGCTASNKCPPATHDALDGARMFATISTVSFIVAGAGAGVAVVALAMGKKPSPEHAAKAKAPPALSPRVSPWVGVGSAGVVGSF